MEFFNDFMTWAWERHHNIWSWYIRPLFLLPFIYFAYKRSLKGIIFTLVALATSMFWFPKPEVVDPKVTEFLKMEEEYLLGDWSFAKVLLSSLVPITMYALAYAFWKHSWKYGVIVINLIALIKMMWSVVAADNGSGWSLVPPALIGLAICNGVIYLAYRWMKKKKSDNTFIAK